MNTINNSLSNQLIINLSILFSQPTGISNYALNLFPYLKSLQPTLLTAKKYSDFNCYPVPNNFTPADGIKGHLRRLMWTQFQLPKIYKNLKSQLLFSPIPEAPLYSNCRFIIMSHDMIPLRFPKPFSPLTPYHRYYTPQVFKQAQHIICNSEATAKDITDFYQVPTKKITPIPLAHDRTHFRFLNLPTSNYFLYIGRQDPYKNLQKLITSFAALPNKGDYELWLAGPTDKRYTPLLQAQVEELGITHRVKFLNYVPYSELPKIINQAIALVFPSLWEGFGFPVLEAMACGTPVITSNVSSLPEVAGDAAILINPHHPGEITAAMQAIINDSEMRKTLSQKGITRANQFSWEKTGQATVEVLSRYL
ncbi:glycosyltransferase family 4 protein [Anabaena cylindrica FACHB-243]|uniref:Glycosyl transferase group 1 n=1 Tax=Anabaena cylindrica (strain ATCC 27899 / PCC 7122) TaxID=272123 RepID=K9ZM42_ANACC|nr:MULTISPECIES: glycosyltransferase family 1 protein [Anabaena]AFZ60256.1 glycosyl transferase group 1 [Anabaena cylindrica PCC 7122]MBD2417691.1 glycosyltransferase family 4 protein [Anabaena cylindrica FACHB-243]MBY5281268.1 glycosyltransferase family 4 protein [Anabaena sp. CCAP 1446/1C]MBY5306648.1 glycosyltransferase family 4 protein [Anabaena sp. CCAP 1446/1C]MCM2404606.1 glycosyltransferase family 4 protein [Anabaena sp. CCAP 1446/1C]